MDYSSIYTYFYISASMHGNYTCSVKKQKMKQPHRIHVWDLDIYLPPFSLVHVAISSPTSNVGIPVPIGSMYGIYLPIPLA